MTKKNRPHFVCGKIVAKVNTVDLEILHWIQNTWGSTALDQAMPYISMLANWGVFWLIVGLILTAFKQYRMYGIQVVSAVVLAGFLVNIVIKPLVDRARPFIVDPTLSLLIEAPTSSSFPSGHSAASIAAAVVICAMPIKIYWKIGAVILALLIAFSRMYLCVHFPSDVLVGCLIGLCCGLLVIALAKRFFPQKEEAK